MEGVPLKFQPMHKTNFQGHPFVQDLASNVLEGSRNDSFHANPVLYVEEAHIRPKK